MGGANAVGISGNRSVMRAVFLSSIYRMCANENGATRAFDRLHVYWQRLQASEFRSQSQAYGRETWKVVANGPL